MGETCYQLAESVSQQPTLDAKGAVFAIASHLDLSKEVTKQTITAAADTKKRNAFVVTGHGIAEDDIPAELTYLQNEDKRVNLTWHLVVRLKDNWFDAHVDAHTGMDLLLYQTKNLTRFTNLGKVLSLVDWVRWDSYLAYAIPNEDPRLGPRVLKVNPADTPASPRGWLDQGRSS